MGVGVFGLFTIKVTLLADNNFIQSQRKLKIIFYLQ